YRVCKNPFPVVFKGLPHRVSFESRRRRVAAAIPGSYQHACRADRARQSDVEPLVPDNERSRGIEMQIAGGAVDESRPRLATVAAAHITVDRTLRMVRTIVIRVNPGAAGLEHGRQMPVH